MGSGASRAPARPPVGVLIVATCVSAGALLALVALGVASGHELLIPPMAASMALIAGAPTLPRSQPCKVVGGQVVSALTGIGVGLLGLGAWLAALAGGLALGVMLLFRMAHSPAAATAVIGAMAVDGQVEFVVCAALATLVLVAFGVLRSPVNLGAYPAYWW